MMAWDGRYHMMAWDGSRVHVVLDGQRPVMIGCEFEARYLVANNPDKGWTVSSLSDVECQATLDAMVDLGWIEP